MIRSLEIGSNNIEEFFNRILTNMQESKAQISKLALWILLKSLYNDTNNQFLRFLQLTDRDSIVLLNSHIFKKIGSTSKLISSPSQTQRIKAKQTKTRIWNLYHPSRPVHQLQRYN